MLRALRHIPDGFTSVDGVDSTSPRAKAEIPLRPVTESKKPGQTRFEKKIQPVSAVRCYSGHRTSVAAPPEGPQLDSTRGIRRGGKSGSAIRRGDLEQSLLVRVIRHPDTTGERLIFFAKANMALLGLLLQFLYQLLRLDSS